MKIKTIQSVIQKALQRSKALYGDRVDDYKTSKIIAEAIVAFQVENAQNRLTAVA